MEQNFLKFKTDNGIPLIFDNYSGIVIPEKKNTEYILKNAEKDRVDILKSLGLNSEYEIEDFNVEYNFLKKLIDAGYFNFEFFKLAQKKAPLDLYDGISSHLILS